MQVREFDPRSLDKILPCPFCGGEAELDTAQSYRAINGHFGSRVVVYCRDCGADQGTCVEDVPDIHANEVIERWNKRTAMPHAVAGLQSTLFTTQRALEACLEASKSIQAREWRLQARIAELEAAMPHAALLREALSALDALIPEAINDRYVTQSPAVERARAAADKIRAALEHHDKGEKL